MSAIRDRHWSTAAAKATFVLSVVALVVALGIRATPGGVNAFRGASPSGSASINYPPGAWHRGQVGDVVLGVAHILVAHSASSSTEDNLAVSGPRPTRTREEALAIALDIAERLQRSPAAFSELATKYSDDATTSQRGGRFGAIHVVGLPARLLDALGELKPGQISRVCETNLGFEIVQRLDLPKEQAVEGQEITIAYHGADLGVRSTHAEAASKRDRASALRLATGVLERLRAGQDFATLATDLSDATTGELGGDIGRHSTYDAEVSITFDVLAALDVGQLSDVVEDGRQGFRILKRTRMDRPTLAESVFLVGNRSSADPDIARSPADARAVAEELVKRLVAEPSRFDAVRQENCDLDVCRALPYAHASGNSPWRGLDRAAESVPVGGIIPAVFETPVGFVVARRDAPTLTAPTPTREFALPAPPEPDERNADTAQILWYIENFKDAASKRLDIHGDEALRFQSILEEFAEDVRRSSSPDPRTEALKKLRAALAVAFGPVRAAQIADFEKHYRASVFGMDY